MFDTMTFTKIGGALAGSLLFFLLLNWAGDLIYYGSEEGGEEEESAYMIEVEGGEEEVVEVAEGPTFAEMLAAADATKGAKVFAKCKACHKLTDGVNATGPFLFGVLDRDVASAEGYSYSKAMADFDGNWTAEALNEFLTKPKAFVPGTKMGFSGLKKEGDRANLIAYLATIGN